MSIKIKKYHVISILAAGFFLLLFIAFTLVVREDMLRSFDFDFTHILQNNTPRRIDPFFSFLSVIGRFEYTLALLIGILIWRRKIWGVIVFGLFGFAHVIELIGKTILNHPGPPSMFLRSEYGDFPGLHVYTDASYPSGHSMRSVFLGILLITFIWQSKKLHLMVKLALIGTILVIVGLMLYSRVSLGEHWTTDVIGGSLLGAAIACASFPLLTKKH